MNGFLNTHTINNQWAIWLKALAAISCMLISGVSVAGGLPSATPGQYKAPAITIPETPIVIQQPPEAPIEFVEVIPEQQPAPAPQPQQPVSLPTAMPISSEPVTSAPVISQPVAAPMQKPAHTLTSTDEISKDKASSADHANTVKAISSSEKSANEKEINSITQIKASPLANPNAALTELAFKFGKGNKRFEGFDKVYGKYCSDARDGNANAQYALGWLHEYGKGVPVDKPLAKVFYSIAAEQDHTLAVKSLPRLTSEQDGTLPKCMLPEPVVYVVEEPKVTLEQLAAIEAEKARKAQIAFEAEEKRKRNMARAERIFKRQKSIYRIVKRLAKKYKMDPKLIMSFIAIESAFDIYATSPKNAQGLMQLIPKTASRFGVENTYDPKQNIRGGIKYIRWLLAYYEGNVALAAAAYNAGEGAVDRYKGVPPYKETQNYVKRLYKLYNKLEHPYRASLVKHSSPILVSYVNDLDQFEMNQSKP